jgi:hypothetical protein
MTFGTTVKKAPFENAPIYKSPETRCQKIARDSNLPLKVLESPDVPECFPQDKKAPPQSPIRSTERAIGQLASAQLFSLHEHILRETKCELKLKNFVLGFIWRYAALFMGPLDIRPNAGGRAGSDSLGKAHFATGPRKAAENCSLGSHVPRLRSKSFRLVNCNPLKVARRVRRPQLRTVSPQRAA